MSSKVENEKKWLESIAIPKMLENGSLIENSPESNVSLKNLRIHKIEIKFVGTEEAFMLTACYRATIEFELNGKLEKRQLFVKRTPQLPEEIFDAICFGALFNNEIITYTKIKPAIEQFTKEILEVPKYFYSDLERYSASIVLEDFGSTGWRVTTDKYNLSLDHVLIAVKYLAKFHGTGFAIRKLRPNEFADITSNLKEPRFDCAPSDEYNLRTTYGIQRVIKITPQYESSVDEKFLKKMEQMLADFRTYGKQLVAPVEPFITLCHGDFLRNNIAFRYDIKDGVEVPIDVMMFDLQTMQISSPMMDLTVLLMLSVFTEVRYKNFELIFETYREHLIKTYENYANETAPPCFSHDALLKEYIRFMPYSIQISSFFLMNMVEAPEIDPDEFLTVQNTPEEIREDVMTRGGEVVNRELSHQVKEMYDLSLKYGVDIAEGINVIP